MGRWVGYPGGLRRELFRIWKEVDRYWETLGAGTVGVAACGGACLAGWSGITARLL